MNLTVATSTTKAVCAELLDRLPAEVAVARDVSRWAVYKRRRRFEQRNGVTLPRLHRVGRPVKSAAA